MVDIVLSGCRPEPLSSYLKGLGVVRLVSTQLDASATSWWVNDTLRLAGAFGADELIAFLTDRYSPTPLLAPWNKGSGFGPDDARKSPSAYAAVERVSTSEAARLGDYRAAIAVARDLAADGSWPGLDKAAQVSRCRSRLPDRAIEWLDAAVVLTTDRLTFPALLGTGGNDGRFDFASNFMSRLAEVFGLAKRRAKATTPRALAAAALFGHNVRLDQAAIGQFSPAAAGGPASSPLGAAESLANPWDFVLLMEGALLFASAAARRLGAVTGAPSSPFLVQATTAGYGTAASERTRGELWVPVWERPAGYGELARFFSEGRVEYRGRQARSGLDMHRAMASLGVDRGIDHFVRYGFSERNGLATFAVPLDRVEARPVAGAPILGDLDSWVGRLRRSNVLPASAAALVREADTAQIDFSRAAGLAAAAQRGRALAAQRLLTAVAKIHALAERSRSVAEAAGGPLRGLRAADWLPLLDDGSDEHAIASALASLRERLGQHTGLLRPLLSDHELSGVPPPVEGFGHRPLADVLGAALARSAVGWDVPPSGWTAEVVGLSAVGRYVSGEADDERLSDLLAAYLLLDWQGHRGRPHREPYRRPLHPALALLKPFFHHRLLRSPAADGSFRPDTSWPRALAAGRVADVLQDVLRRLRINGLPPLLREPDRIAVGIEAPRLAAACLIPVSTLSIDRLVRQVAVVSTSLVNTPTTTHEEVPT